jgi:hypothetical protein
MRIRLRPYHPTWIIAFFGLGGMKEGYNKRGFDYVMDAIRRDPDIEVEFVECHDDICERCDRRVPDEKGCVWGKHHTCSSAQEPQTVESVHKANRQVLELLGLTFGSVLRFRDIVNLLAERLSDLGKSGIGEIGGPSYQAQYERGMAVLRELSFRKSAKP